MNINLRSDKLLFVHKGTITKELIELVVEALEQSVTNLEEDRKVRRKITNVFIEVFQNIGFHGAKDPEFSSSDMVIVISMPNHYKIGTTNLVELKDVEKIKSAIDEINDSTQDELREKYKLALSTNEVSDKGTAGLGFIDIARKSEQKLYYEFEEVSDKYAFFYFETHILKNYADGNGSRSKKSASIHG